MPKTIIIFICVLVYISGNSQPLYKGKLVSGLTGKPIKGAYIEFNSVLLGDTDSTGAFTIALDIANDIPLIFYSPEIGWIVKENLNFYKDSIALITLTPECEYSAEKDIQEEKFKLFIASGPFSPSLTKADYKFEKKYAVNYYGDGDCTSAIATDCLYMYNQTIFTYLDKKYGKNWRKKVNKNVYGL